jgi:acyl-CoA reductase-like NAD-dependent aldehyde dehydrogenase
MLVAEAGKNVESDQRELSRRRTMIESQIESKNFIGGEWVPADSGEVYEVTNPANPSEVLGTTPKSGKAEAERAVEAAAEAAPGWKATLPAERGAILSKTADIIESRTDELAELMAREVGKPMGESKAEVARAAAIFRYYGSEGWRLNGIMPPSTRPGIQISSAREPLGVVSLITPWNFPLAIPAWKMAPALICGNTIAIKPASDASLDAAALVRALAEAGLPDGVVNMVTGSGSTVGDALVTDPRVKAVSFTGSTPVGLGIQERAVGKKVQLEMGGKNPYVVMEDADLADAAAKISYGAFGYAGQKCTASSRAIVVEEVYDELLDELTRATEAMKVGDPLDDEVLVGPVVNQSQYESILEAIETARGEGRVVLDGGATEDEGYYISPVIVADVDNKSRTAQEEIFGPVLAVIPARDFDHAVELANDTRYGLTSGIATRSLRYAYEFIARSEAGLANVNVPTAGLEFQVPFGGNKESGVGGREQGPAAIDFYSAWKTVAIRPV